MDSDDEIPQTAVQKSLGEGAISDSAAYFMDRAKYIPLRLDLTERKKLRLLEAALNVSEYTDKVDIFSQTSRAKRIHGQLREICAILCGLVVASDYNEGQKLIESHDFFQFADFFQEIFEIGRRYKIVNPGWFSRLPEILESLSHNSCSSFFYFSAKQRG